MKTVLNGIIKENSVFVLSLGLCSALAVTTTVENAYLMGLCVFIVLIFSNLIISLIKKIVPDNVRIPVYIIIVGTFVVILEMLLKEFIPTLYSALGIYLPLIVVNCIVLGRALSVASKETVLKSVLDAVGVGLGYTLSITLIALIREILGNNSITIIDGISSFTGVRIVFEDIFKTSEAFPISIFKTSAGAFITLAMLLALFNKIKGGKKDESN